MAQEPYFHDESSSVRFWVQAGDALVGASIGRATLHYRFRPGVSGDDPLQTFAANVETIEAAVRRRLASGSIEPVMVREHDLRDDDVR